MMIEQAAYEGEGGVGLIVPDELFPRRPQRTGWRLKYTVELDAHPHLLAILNGNRGIEGVYDAAGLTDTQREAIELIGAGFGYRESARSLGIHLKSFQERVSRALANLAPVIGVLNGGVLHVA